MRHLTSTPGQKAKVPVPPSKPSSGRPRSGGTELPGAPGVRLRRPRLWVSSRRHGRRMFRCCCENSTEVTVEVHSSPVLDEAGSALAEPPAKGGFTVPWPLSLET